MHGEFAAAAERHALHRGDHRHLRVLQGHRCALELRHDLFELVEPARRAGLADLLQVGADGEGGFVPDHQAVQGPFGPGHGGEQAVDHLVADGMHLRLEGNDADPGIHLGQAPQAHAVVLVQGLAGLLRRRAAGADH